MYIVLLHLVREFKRQQFVALRIANDNFAHCLTSPTYVLFSEQDVFMKTFASRPKTETRNSCQ